MNQPMPDLLLVWDLGDKRKVTFQFSQRRGFAPGFVNYKKWCTRLSAASDKVYQLLAHGRWLSPGAPMSSTTKTGRHDIAEILLKVALHKKTRLSPTPFNIPSLSVFRITINVLDLLFMNQPMPDLLLVWDLGDNCKVFEVTSGNH
jgi:hypothetical protein